jgi:hypothetical protein
MTTSMVANRWYDHNFNKVHNVYPTPQSILRFTVGVADYKFLCDTVSTDHIRAAIIIDKDKPFSHLMNTPWSMTYTTDSYRMIIVSVLNIQSWLDLAVCSGAHGFFKAHSMTITYQWEPPRLDSTGNKYRPPGAPMPDIPEEPEYDFGFVEKKRKWTPPKTDFDREALLADIREGVMLQQALQDKYGLTRVRIKQIASEVGLVVGRNDRRALAI